MAYTEVPVTNFKGFSYDPPARSMPNEVWTLLINARIENGSVVLAQPINSAIDTPSDPPYNIYEYTDEASNHGWFYSADTKLYYTDGTTTTDVSRTVGGAYSPDTDIGWDGGVYNRLPCFTNSTDTFQIKEIGDTDFKDDPNFPANYTAEQVRSYQNRIVVFRLRVSGTPAMHTVLISDIADPGYGPASWDAADPTTQANEIDLSETEGEIVDGLPLGESFYVYKQDSVWRITYVGGTYVDSVSRVAGASGALAPHCVQEFAGNHFVVGVGDIYIHGGSGVKSVISEDNRKLFYSQINPDFTTRVFTIKQEEKSLIWVCYPSHQSTTGACDQAFLWNWVTGDWGHTNLPDVRSATLGVVDDATPVTFDGVGWGDGYFDDDIGSYNEGGTNPSVKDVIFVSYDNTKFYEVGIGSGIDGQNATWYALKNDVNVTGDHNSQHLTQIIPLVEGDVDFSIRIGSRDNLGADVNWSNIIPFTMGESYKLDLRVSGRYLSVLYGGVSSLTSDFKLYGYILVGGVSGRR